MRFYLASSSTFPRSLRLRLAGICLLATQTPLLAWLGWSAASGQPAPAEFALMAVASLAGAAIALLGLSTLLARIPAAQERRGTVTPLPLRAADPIGSLLASVHHAASAADARMRELDLAAKEDLLTGARNRRGFLADIEDFLPAERRGTIALLDLNGFRRINDQFGHEVGDRVLRDFAGRLSSELRRGDLVARWDGEQFAVLFRGATEDEAAGVLGRVTRRLIANPLILLDGEALTFSAGVCRFGGEAIDATIAGAETALGEARRAGRSRVACASRPGQVLLPLA
jgi:diguanylate cyclase